MNRLFRTFFIFLLLLSTRTAIAQTNDLKQDSKKDTASYAAKASLSKNLAGLTGIESIQYQVPRQTSADLDTLYRRAPAAQDELAHLLANITSHAKAQSILPDIKRYDRAKAKIDNKFNGDASQITDLARASIISNDIHNLMQAYDILKSETQVLRVKNRFAEPKASGYRDLNVLIRLPETDMIAEVQLHLSEISQIKNGAEHSVYELVQSIEANAEAQRRELSEMEAMRITQLRQDSHKLYHKAWLQYKRIDEASLLTPIAA